MTFVISISCSRYLLHDTWNILDTMTIIAILAALVSRLWGYFGESTPSNDEESFTEFTIAHISHSYSPSEKAFFFSRFFLASIAPMLFARLLFLSQIDPVLGPMTQV